MREAKYFYLHPLDVLPFSEAEPQSHRSLQWTDQPAPFYAVPDVPASTDQKFERLTLPLSMGWKEPDLAPGPVDAHPSDHGTRRLFPCRFAAL